MTRLTSIVLILISLEVTASADTIESKELSISPSVQSFTTEPTPLPEEDDQATESGYVPPAPAPSSPYRAPSNLAPQKYVDSELGIACYYFLPVTIPGVIPSGSPAISCVSYKPHIVPVLSPQNAPRSTPPPTN